MIIIGQITLLSIIGFLGTALSSLLPITIPPSIVGLVILLILLLTHVITLHHIDTVAHFFLAHMGLLFIPPVINIIDQFHVLGTYILQFIIICVITTLFTLIASVGSAKLVMKLQLAYRSQGDSI